MKGAALPSTSSLRPAQPGLGPRTSCDSKSLNCCLVLPGYCVSVASMGGPYPSFLMPHILSLSQHPWFYVLQF